MLIAYDSRIKPPAPFVEVWVTNLTSQITRTARAKLDTGASITVIPDSMVGELGLYAMSEILAFGFDRTGFWRKIYLISLQVQEYSFPVEVVSSPREDVLLGRDILNQFIITLDGKAQTFEMYDP